MGHRSRCQSWTSVKRFTRRLEPMGRARSEAGGRRCTLTVWCVVTRWHPQRLLHAPSPSPITVSSCDRPIVCLPHPSQQPSPCHPSPVSSCPACMCLMLCLSHPLTPSLPHFVSLSGLWSLHRNISQSPLEVDPAFRSACVGRSCSSPLPISHTIPLFCPLFLTVSCVN